MSSSNTVNLNVLVSVYHCQSLHVLIVVPRWPMGENIIKRENVSWTAEDGVCEKKQLFPHSTAGAVPFGRIRSKSKVMGSVRPSFAKNVLLFAHSCSLNAHLGATLWPKKNFSSTDFRSACSAEFHKERFCLQSTRLTAWYGSATKTPQQHALWIARKTYCWKKTC